MRSPNHKGPPLPRGCFSSGKEGGGGEGCPGAPSPPLEIDSKIPLPHPSTQHIQVNVDQHNRGSMVRQFTVGDRLLIKRAMVVGGPKLHPQCGGLAKLTPRDGEHGFTARLGRWERFVHSSQINSWI